jgi:F-type H+-transporting ATPase subunit delta
MTSGGLAHRYAKALFQAALDAGADDDVFGDVQSLMGLAAEMPQVREFLLSPQISPVHKHALIDRAFAGRAHKLLIDLFHLLIDKKRIVLVMDMGEAYIDIYYKHKGMIAVKAISAVPLAERQKERLVSILERRTEKTVRLTQEVDPHVLGGMVLKMDGEVIDGTVRYQLDQLKRRLMEIKVIRVGEAADGGAV